MAEFEINSVVVCDDIRKENNNKDLLIGVYSGDIVIPNVNESGVLLLYFWIEFTVKDAGEHVVEIKIEAGGHPAFEARDIKANILEPVPTVLPLGPIPIQIRKAGDLKLMMRMDGRRWRVIKTKRVRTVESLPNSPPPT